MAKVFLKMRDEGTVTSTWNWLSSSLPLAHCLTVQVFLLYRQTVLLVVGNRRELDVVEVRLELAAFLGRSLMLEGT